MSRVWTEDVRSSHASPSEAPQLSDGQATVARQALCHEGSPQAPDSRWSGSGSDAGSSLRMPCLQGLAYHEPTEAELAQQDPHEIRALVVDQLCSSTSEPRTRLRTEDRPTDRSVLVTAFSCPDWAVRTAILRPGGQLLPLVEFVSGHVGFRCLQCGEAIIIEGANER